MSLTVIYANAGDEDCKHLVHAWDGVKDTKVVEINDDVLYNDDKWRYRVEDAISNEDDTILFIGHGSPDGLLQPDFRGYILHRHNVHLVHARRVICIWCYASSFCRTAGLKSVSSSMFISNVGEAMCNGICAEQETINEDSARFHKQIRTLIESDIPMSEWKGILDGSTDTSDEVDVFNRNGVTYIG